MRCVEARELFSARLDGELAPHEAAALEAHLAACAACRAELAAWEELSGQVRALAADMRAPEGFARRVAARLPAERRGRLARLGDGLRRGLAVAAAFGVILAGSLGYAAFRWMGDTPAGPGGPGPTTVAHNVPQGGTEKQSLQPPGGGDAPPPSGGDRTGPAVAPRTGGETPEATTITPAPAGDETGPRAFLSSKERVLARTLLHVVVEDAGAAAQKALALAKAAGAQLKDKTTTRQGDVFQTYTIDTGKAADLCNQLETLGRCVSRQEETQDVTAAYDRDLERYRNLLTQAGAAEDPQEQERLTREAEALAAELNARDREASRHTIVLWLEQNPAPE
ncbi:MAG: Putative transmembrane anti-sigma factor [Clostridia bacterium 62_21]|nr:MAG: Putative transmembrane anti-sigma factor [Clostridia bacterium 62_21]